MRILKNSINALSGLAFPIFAGGVVLAWPLTAAVSSPSFLSSRDAVTGALVPGSDVALKILLVAMAFTYLHVALSYTLVALGRQIELLGINAVVVAVNVVLNFFLVPKYGFVGAAISATVAEVVMFAALVLRVRRRVSHVWDAKFLLKMATSAAVMGGVLWLVEDFFQGILGAKSLAVTIPFGALVFIACAWALRAFSPEMLALLKKPSSTPPEQNP